MYMIIKTSLLRLIVGSTSYVPGHPVVNDPLYNHPVFGPNKGRGGDIGKTEAQLVADLIQIHNSDNWLGDTDTETSPAEMTSLDQDLVRLSSSARTEDTAAKDCAKDTAKDSEDSAGEPEAEDGRDPHCYECRVRYRDPGPEDLVMYLHALRYQVSCSDTPYPSHEVLSYSSPHQSIKLVN